jgi:hypothetical protein
VTTEAHWKPGCWTALPPSRNGAKLAAILSGGSAMRSRAVILAVAIVMAPPGAGAADLVVWWEKGFYAQRDGSISEIVAAFEQGTGQRLDWRRMDLENEVAKAIVAVSDAKRRLSSSIRSHKPKCLRDVMILRPSTTTKQ